MSARLTLHVLPRAARSAVAGPRGDAVKVRLAAPPVGGAANAELVRFLAERLGVRKDAVRLVAGASGRRKVVAIEGLEAAEALRRLLTPSPAGGTGG